MQLLILCCLGWCDGGGGDKPDCLLRKEFRTLGWEICRRTGYTFDDIYIHWHDMVGEHVVYLKGKFAGYVEGFWMQGHIYNHYDGI